jgi:phosphatidylinositol glycan class H protein
MLTSTMHLAVRQPSPTTISYTVSNAYRRETISAHIIFYLTIILRALIFLSTLFVLGLKSELQTGGKVLGREQYDAVTAQIPPTVREYVEGTRWQIVVPVALGVMFLCFKRFHTGAILCQTPIQLALTDALVPEESLLVLRTLGIQTSTTSSTYLSTATTRFIPTSAVQDTFIHEAFKGFEVRYYLGVAVKGEGEITVVFPTLLPGRAIVEQVWRGARGCLWQGERKEGKQQGERKEVKKEGS